MYNKADFQLGDIDMDSSEFESNFEDIHDTLNQQQDIKEVINYLLLTLEQTNFDELEELLKKALSYIGGKYGLSNNNQFLQTDRELIILGLLRELKSRNSLASIYNTEILTTPSNPYSYIKHMSDIAKEEAINRYFFMDTDRFDSSSGLSSSYYNKFLGKEVPYDRNNPRHNKDLISPDPRKKKYLEFKQKNLHLYPGLLEELEQEPPVNSDYPILNHSFWRDKNGKVNLNEYEDGVDFLEKMEFIRNSFWLLRGLGVVPNNAERFRERDYDEILSLLQQNELIERFPKFKTMDDPDYSLCVEKENSSSAFELKQNIQDVQGNKKKSGINICITKAQAYLPKF